MKTCPACQKNMNDKTDFCTSCGASLKNAQRSQKQSEKKQKNKGFKFILVGLFIAVSVGLYIGYQSFAEKYSEETVKEQFETALLNEDRASLKELIHPDDPRLIISDSNLDALFALIENERSIIYEMIEWLNDEQLASYPFTIKQDGKHYGLFDRYVVNAKGYYMNLTNVSDEVTTFYYKDKEIGTLKKEEEQKQVGPFLPGSYLVNAMSDEAGEKGEDMTSVKLSGTDIHHDVALNTTVYEEEKEEIIRYVTQSHNAYILPHSATIYLNLSDITHLTRAELRLARNEIFARHGYVFESNELQNYFLNQTWYYPDIYYNGSLSKVEASNIALIKSLE